MIKASGTSRSLILKDLIFYRWKHKAFLLLVSLVASAFGLLSPFFQKEFLDRLLGNPSLWTLTWNSESYLIAAVLSLALYYGLNQWTQWMGLKEGQSLQRLWSDRMYSRLLNTPSVRRNRQMDGEYVAIYSSDIPNAVILIEQSLPQGASILFPILLAPFLLEKIFSLSYGLGLSTLLLIVGLNSLLALRQSGFFSRFKELASNRVALTSEWISNIKLLRVLGWMEHFEKKIFQVRETETVNRLVMLVNGQTMNSVATSITFFLNLAALTWLLHSPSKAYSSGELLALLWIVGIFLSRPFRQLPWIITYIFDSWTSIKRLADLLDQLEPENDLRKRPVSPLHSDEKGLRPTKGAVFPVSDNSPLKNENPNSLVPFFNTPFVPSSHPGQTSSGGLVVRGLNLSLGGKKLLSNIDFQIEPGRQVAVLGEVGSGKSLLLQSLLMETGADFKDYFFNSLDFQKLPASEVRSYFGYVPQESFILNASLRENIWLSFSSAKDQDDKILSLLDSVQLDLIEDKLSEGLETLFGEKGVNLSGGQKQRLSLARALFFDRSLLLLDDVLSAVDERTESLLIKQLFKGSWKNKTVLITTQRWSLLPYVDEIFWMEHGSIKARGSLEDLLKRSDFEEFYRNLQHKTQTREISHVQ